MNATAVTAGHNVILDGGPNGGLFPLVSDVGITNDDMSPLSPAGTQTLFSGRVTFQVDEPRLPDPMTATTSFRMLFFSDTRLLRIDTLTLLGLMKGPLPQ